jgi:hypothetical protein
MAPGPHSLTGWRPAAAVVGFTVLVCAAVPAQVVGQPTAPVSSVVWTLDRLDTIGGHPVQVVGSPRIVVADGERVLEFDGVRDGLIVNANPLAGLARFTIEVVFAPAPDGPEEQRFLHVEESGTGNRALIELRMLPGAKWCLDTYLRHGEANLTLIDRDRTHSAGQWHAAALTFDGTTMTHYVDRVRQGGGGVAFVPLKDGQTSIGVRQNLVSFFKGRIRLVRFTPEALAASALLEPRG